ncbi:MAG: acetyl-CoA acetyltransferase [Myxococcota bacterium]|nr:acetyl-CoA acetyltransferase [Myxococcota bacterium]
MSLDPRTPVLVGAAELKQREDDPEKALDHIGLMTAALERAGEDARSPHLLARADSIRVPRGFWGDADPCRILADRLGAASARTEVAEVGVLQTTLLGRAAADIAAGRCEVVLLAGGEARHRSARERQLGRTAPPTAQEGSREADSVLRPSGEIISQLEIQAGLTMPVSQYALVENALRAVDGQTLDAHRNQVAELWAGMSRVAATNPNAWDPEVRTAEQIGEPGPGNRMLAFPYTKLEVSQWNVDQAAGLVLCSAATAEAVGVPRAQWVFPLAVVDSDHMVALTRRAELHRCPGFAVAGAQALSHAGRQAGDVSHRELYSCFPAAVRVQQRELGVPEGAPVTVTGGMTFGGGPLNNFVLHAWARMARVLRADPGSTGMVTAVSGILTKQGVTLFSTEPGPGFCFSEVGDQTAAQLRTVEVAERPEGRATVASYTVLYEGEDAARAALVCDLDDGRRGIVVADDPELAVAMTREEFCGRRLVIGAEGDLAFG